MITYEDNCVFCPHCINCGRKRQKVYYCDNCKESTDELYEYEGAQLCEGCLLDKVPKVEG
jgi:hypothetical protein